MTMTVGAQTQVNTATIGYQYNPLIVGLEGGGWVVTWGDGDEPFSSGIFQQVYDADGNPLSSTDLGVNTYVTYDQRDQRITALDGGGWVITWTSYKQDGHYDGIYQRLYDADGTPASIAEQLVNTSTARYEMSSTVVALAGGGWVVTWVSSDYDIATNIGYMQAFNASGNAVGGEQAISTITNVNFDGVKVAALSDGGWVAAWSNPDAYNPSSIFLQRFDRHGAALATEEEQVSTTMGGAVTDVISLSGGGYVVTWSQPNPVMGPSTNTIYRAYDANGQPLAVADARLSSATYSTEADIAALPDGGWVATWTEGSQGNYTVNQQVYRADGTT
ncbi:MAG: hypothetical protein EOP21_02805, partial [Hyphomicrobiales bacterium]